jgi:hypothetical protein
MAESWQFESDLGFLRAVGYSVGINAATTDKRRDYLRIAFVIALDDPRLASVKNRGKFGAPRSQIRFDQLLNVLGWHHENAAARAETSQDALRHYLSDREWFMAEFRDKIR